MNHLHYKRITAFALASLMLGLSSHAAAQYVWLDEKGVKQYSDMAPPAAVPNSHILKSPRAPSRGAASSVAPEAAEGGAPTAAASDKKLPMTTAEKNAEFQKRRMEQAEKDKKSADDAQRAADKSKNCERASAYQKALDSGQRIARQEKNGQRAFLSDAQRAQEARDTRKILSECK
ncbi:DUF4124 domain-containing protein [Herminiimonas sp. CN]|uniref:DUF4124 domain-containing protein n=1 Tax=Herminiimonas sp. CN TaxID=1349818 RepID=UPI000473A07A|nr:DUF4124 domain-containing protein [Herminiimonas sp. CN]